MKRTLPNALMHALPVASLLLCATAAFPQGFRVGQGGVATVPPPSNMTVASGDINGQRCTDLNNRAQQNLNAKIASVKPGTADSGVGSLLTSPVSGGAIFNIPGFGSLVNNAGMQAFGGGNPAHQAAYNAAMGAINNWQQPTLPSWDGTGAPPVATPPIAAPPPASTPPGSSLPQGSNGTVGYTVQGPNGPYIAYGPPPTSQGGIGGYGFGSNGTYAPVAQASPAPEQGFSITSPSTWTPYIKSLF